MRLLDANVCIDVLRGRPDVAARLAAHGPAGLFLCSVVKVELAFGARLASEPLRAADVVDAFCAPFVSLPFDDTCIDAYARFRADLRAAGLSGQKVTYLRDLAAHVADGRLDLPSLRHKSDDEVIAAIVAVKGFGVWSAQMFLMFCLHRPDVLPTGDLGIVKGMQLVLGMKSRPAQRTMERAAQAWKPYRSIACWYVWRRLELE